MYADISKYRKLRGLTQEELGKVIGVSSQAVSKWENGGTPDISLIPVIADLLGVSIETLFGREMKDPIHIEEMLSNYLSTIPKDQRMHKLCELLIKINPYVLDTPPLLDVSSNKGQYLRSFISSNEGIALSSPDKDHPFYMIMAEGEEGYLASFGKKEEYTKLFKALSYDHSLDILNYLYQQKNKYHLLNVISEKLKIDRNEAKEVLDLMVEANLLDQQSIQLETGDSIMYSIKDYRAYIPFMLLARWMCEDQQYYYYAIEKRTEPLLKEIEND